MKFRVISASVIAAGALLLCASPAYAIGPGNAGSQCMTTSCDAWALLGAGPPGGGNTTVVLPPPPPCQVVPVGDAQAGSQIIISFYQGSAVVAQPSGLATASASPATTPTGGALGAGDQAILNQAEQLASASPVPAGEWYQVIPTTSADQATCARLPLFIWQAGKGTGALRKVGLLIPLGTLASLLYSQVNLPQVSSVVLSPQAKIDTNLPTSVQVALAPGLNSPIFLTAGGVPYVMASADTPLGAATVWAIANGLSITPGTPDAQTFDDVTQCLQAHPGPAGNTVMLGSRLTAAQMATIGAGGSVDCGVTYNDPGSFNLTVSVTWKACWVPGPPTPGGPPANCRAVKGAQGLQASASNPVALTVRSIVANNG
jgi:hypothetical protein